MKALPQTIEITIKVEALEAITTAIYVNQLAIKQLGKDISELRKRLDEIGRS